MATTAQILANRNNSRKSTGPKTDEGKAAVSQNAVKHGIFAESVIQGENEDDYEAFHDKMLAELAPVGTVESMLAERIVSLWWRLRRAERMQNEVIEDMIERKVTNPAAIKDRERRCYNEGIRPGDPRFNPEHLALGRIATSDWANCRILDRMMLYERRIESSMIKIMKELKRFQTMRRIELQNAEKIEPSTSLRDEDATRSNPPSLKDEAATRSAPVRAIPSTALRTGPISINDNRDEAATPKVEKQVDLKKQTQFAVVQLGAKSLEKGGYDKKAAGGDEENKAKQSQFQGTTSPPEMLEEKKGAGVAVAEGEIALLQRS
jgi:hypothetical protein